MRVIADHFDLPWPEPWSVKEADRQMLVTEAAKLMEHQHEDWHLAYGYEPDPEVAILPLTTNGAYRYFLSTFYRIKNS